MRIRKEYMLSSRNIAMSKPHKSVYYSNHSILNQGNMDVSSESHFSQRNSKETEKVLHGPGMGNVILTNDLCRTS